MAFLLEQKVDAFLKAAAAESVVAKQELVAFFSDEIGAKRYAVVNGNLSFYEADKLVKIVEVPGVKLRDDGAFRFDGVGISIVNSSDSDPKKKSSSGGSSNNNNNNNNNNNG